jgi:3-deoxy-7-phosphoheptulonate synthase
MTSNMNIEEIKEIIPPHVLQYTFPPNKEDIQFVNSSRKTIEEILLGSDKRLLVIVGPCSIHDYEEYMFHLLVHIT